MTELSKEAVKRYLKFFKKAAVNRYLQLPHSDVRPIMRPGWELRVKIFGGLVLWCRGYQGEFAVHQIGSEADGDPTNRVPVTPSFIAAQLHKVAIEEFRRAGKEISIDARRQKTDGNGKPIEPLQPWHRIPLKYIGRCMDGMECEDRILKNVTFPPLLSADRNVRQQGKRDIKLVIRELMTYQEALSHQMIIPIRELSKLERQRLAGKSFTFWLVDHGAATLEALMRHSDVDLDETGPHIALDSAGKRVFTIARALGLQDRGFAADAARLSIIRPTLEEITAVEQTRQGLEAKLKQQLAPIVEAYKNGQPIDSVTPAESQQPLPGFMPDVVKSSPLTWTAEKFHNEVCKRFSWANKDVPTLKQTAEIWPLVKGREEDFMKTQLSREKLARVVHPGVLSSLVQNFRDTSSEPIPGSCIHCGAPPERRSKFGERCMVCGKNAEQPDAPTPVVCARCQNSGVIGASTADFMTGELVEAIRAGGQCCDCQSGAWLRDWIDQERKPA